MNAPREDLKASDIKQLDQRLHVRKRVGMYLGGNADDGLTVGLRELVDNAFDEVLGGYNDTTIVRFFEDGSAEVEDHGRGLPVDKNEKGVNGIILTIGTIGSGGKFSGKAISGGLNGVGASATCATSSRMDVTVYKDGKKHELSFKEGLPGFFDKPNDPTAKFTPNKEIKVSKDDRPAALRKKAPTGTTIRYWADYTVFIPGSKFNVADIDARMRATAFLLPGVTSVVEDYRDPKNPVVNTYHFEGGVSDMLPALTRHSLVTKPIHLRATTSFSEVTNVLQEDGSLKQAEVERPVDMEVAFAYTNVEETVLKSYVNIINTKNGGTHESGMWRALSRVIINHIKNNKGFLKAKEEPPILDDVRDGFVGVVSVKFPEPTFTGQEKSTLATPQMTSLVSQTIGAELQKWMSEKKNAAQVKALCQKVVEASRIRLAARQQKEVARKKSALETAASLPAKLVPAASDDSSFTELFLCEGDSALGGLKSSRSALRTAIYPLKGKPLNSYDAPLSTVLKNQEWTDLIQIIGAGVGKEFRVDDMRYSKVVILADGDADGSHIRALLIAGLWRLMPDLVRHGRLYVAMPPLFSITTTNKGKERFYALNDAELPTMLTKLKKQGYKWDKVVRHKGLGEYSADILAEVVMDPETRVLKQITVDDAEKFEQVLELTMGKNAAGRRDWIIENRELISAEQIDA